MAVKKDKALFRKKMTTAPPITHDWELENLKDYSERLNNGSKKEKEEKSKKGQETP